MPDARAPYVAGNWKMHKTVAEAHPDVERMLNDARDRFYDLYVHLPMQKIMLDRLRPEGKTDPHGVEEARAQLRTSYAMIEQQMAKGAWAMGEDFSLADCAAAPPPCPMASAARWAAARRGSAAVSPSPRSCWCARRSKSSR